MTVRIVLVLKPDKTIALELAYPASTGRNFDEILRVFDSLQRTASRALAGKALATPVHWCPGDKATVNFPSSNAKADEKFGKEWISHCTSTSTCTFRSWKRLVQELLALRQRLVLGLE